MPPLCCPKATLAARTVTACPCRYDGFLTLPAGVAHRRRRPVQQVDSQIEGEIEERAQRKVTVTLPSESMSETSIATPSTSA